MRAFLGAPVVLLLSLAAEGRGQSWSFTRVVDTNTPVPGGTGTFAAFAPPTLSDGGISFTGVSSAAQDGVYVQNFYSVSVGSQDAVFEARSQGQSNSLYLASSAGIAPVADAGTTVPGTTSTFAFAAGPSIDGRHVAFYGSSDPLFGPGGQGGVFLYDTLSGEYATVVRQFDAAPGGGNVGVVFAPSVSGDVMGFLGRNQNMAGPLALFANVDGQISRIIGEGDTLDGRTVAELVYLPEGHDGTSFVFALRFQGLPSLQAVYVATLVPAPGAAGAMVVVLASAGLRRRRRGQAR